MLRFRHIIFFNFYRSTPFSLSSESFQVCGPILLFFFCSDSFLNDHVEESVASPLHLCVCLSPSRLVLISPFRFWNICCRSYLAVKHMINFVWNVNLLFNRDMFIFEVVIWSWILRSISEKNLIGLGPVLDGLLEIQTRLILWCFNNVRHLPPSFAFFSFRKLREFLAMNSNCHISKFFEHVSDQLFASCLSDFRHSFAFIFFRSES